MNVSENESIWEWKYEVFENESNSEKRMTILMSVTSDECYEFNEYTNYIYVS